MTGLRRDGDASSTLSFSYHFPPASPYTNDPFYTQVTQKVDSSNTFTTRTYYNSLGKLLQTEGRGASVNGVARDILTDSYVRRQRESLSASRCLTTSRPAAPITGGILPTRRHLHRLRCLRPPDGGLTATDGTLTSFVYQNTTWNSQVYVEDTRHGRQRAQHQQPERRLGQERKPVTPPTGPGVVYAYDEADRLVEAVRGGVSTGLIYDLAGRKTAMDDPDMGEWSYTYDAIGEPAYAERQPLPHR